MKNQKGFLPVIIILVVLIGFVGVYYLGILKSNKITESPTPFASNQSVSKPTVVQTPSPIDCENTFTLDTLDWKEYFFQDMSFKFKYPDYLDVKIFPENTSRKGWLEINNNKNNSVMKIGYQKGIVAGPGPFVNEQLVLNGQNLCVFGKNVQGDVYTFNNHFENSLRIEYPDNRNYAIGINYKFPNKPTDKDLIIFDQILSTFKFTN